MRNKTAPQTRTVPCCVLALVIRGTLTARVMAQKESRPSVACISARLPTFPVETLTDSRDNLRFKAELVLETSSEVRNPTLTVSSNVWDLANVVEHVAACEEKNRHQADGRPDVAVLDNRQNIRRSSGQCSSYSQQNRDPSRPAHVVDGSLHRRCRSAGHMSRKPGMNVLSSSSTMNCQKSN